MKKLIVLLLAAGLAGGGWWFWKQRQALENGAAERSFKPAQVEKKTLRRFVESTGEVRPENRLGVKSPVSGRIEELRVDEGDAVERGQVIAWVSSTERATLLDAARAKSEEDLNYWETVYKAAPLIAPLAGTVISRDFEPGQTLSASDAVVVIADRLIVVGQVDETDIGAVSVGQRVEVQLDAYPDTLFHGTVASIAYDSKLVSNVTMYEVDVTPGDLPAVARSGMTATLTFVAEVHKETPAVPTAALEYEAGRAFVRIPGPNPGTPQRIAVEPGLSENGWTEIGGELAPGDTVLVPRLVRKKENGASPFMPNRKKK